MQMNRHFHNLRNERCRSSGNCCCHSPKHRNKSIFILATRLDVAAFPSLRFQSNLESPFQILQRFAIESPSWFLRILHDSRESSASYHYLVHRNVHHLIVQNQTESTGTFWDARKMLLESSGIIAGSLFQIESLDQNLRLKRSHQYKKKSAMKRWPVLFSRSVDKPVTRYRAEHRPSGHK